MKKILLLIMFFYIHLNAGLWSSLSYSGFNEAYAELNGYVSEENKYIENFWKERIRPLIENIAKQTKEKDEKLKVLRELEKENLLIQKKIDFLLNQKKELLSNEANAISR
ncbi:hypothetical protein CDJ58_03735 [Campylobacter lari]|uniref:Uncharacterized protein n=1 Tax=Campylobacter peloridis TaxID=488546 RepID=A0A5C7E2H4_9BACT|nr:hypothetical protein [Campylobacter peloridis]EAH8851040.1 hypothetical protein [Campylobacter lari]EAK5748510.1 hypothetical protein [Campylobacter lari]EAK9878167.1 hypothetical protein [Campylobacter lari]TXE84764.1 hypothetical protein FPD46_00580 [Campylobacter peloridis]